MVAFGAVFSLQVMKFFNDVFLEGLRDLETTVQVETQTGNGFVGR